MDINAAGGSEAGATPEKIAALTDFRGSNLFTPAERVALELAEAATALPHDVSDELFARLREHYDDDEILDLSICLVAFMGLGRVLSVLRIDPSCSVDW
jgi:alkylhydroperoxidase family enzyme